MKKWMLFLFFVIAISTRAWADDKYDWFNYSMLLQTWDTQNIDGQNVSIVRRAENKFTFKLSKDFMAVAMLDPAKVLVDRKDNSWLQDAFVQWQLSKNWMVK